MARAKMTKDTIPEGFTMGLVLVDALPVLFFGASMAAVGVLFRSILFLMGAALALFAGAAKVIWKLIVVWKRKNIWWLFLQMRIALPIGLGLMILGLFLDGKNANLTAIGRAMMQLPAAACFGIGALGMVLMTVFAFRLDSSDVKANWIEQLTNGIAQGAIFLGLVFTIMGR